jgi:hypothetical protein
MRKKEIKNNNKKSVEKNITQHNAGKEALKKYNTAKLMAPKINVPIAMDLYPSL